MNHNLPALAVLATFADRISAEIACALLSDASIRSDEPEAAEDGNWCIRLQSLPPILAARAEVILRSARARDTTITTDERQEASHGLRTPGFVRHDSNMSPTLVPTASGIP